MTPITRPYPHAGGCPCCRERQVCNACGKPLGAGRCSNGRCHECHMTVCVVAGDLHGYGNPYKTQRRNYLRRTRNEKGE